MGEENGHDEGEQQEPIEFTPTSMVRLHSEYGIQVELSNWLIFGKELESGSGMASFDRANDFNAMLQNVKGGMPLEAAIPDSLKHAAIEAEILPEPAALPMEAAVSDIMIRLPEGSDENILREFLLSQTGSIDITAGGGHFVIPYRVRKSAVRKFSGLEPMEELPQPLEFGFGHGKEELVEGDQPALEDAVQSAEGEVPAEARRMVSMSEAARVVAEEYLIKRDLKITSEQAEGKQTNFGMPYSSFKFAKKAKGRMLIWDSPAENEARKIIESEYFGEGEAVTSEVDIGDVICQLDQEKNLVRVTLDEEAILNRIYNISGIEGGRNKHKQTPVKHKYNRLSEEYRHSQDAIALLIDLASEIAQDNLYAQPSESFHTMMEGYEAPKARGARFLESLKGIGGIFKKAYASAADAYVSAAEGVGRWKEARKVRKQKSAEEKAALKEQKKEELAAALADAESEDEGTAEITDTITKETVSALAPKTYELPEGCVDTVDELFARLAENYEGNPGSELVMEWLLGTGTAPAPRIITDSEGYAVVVLDINETDSALSQANLIGKQASDSDAEIKGIDDAIAAWMTQFDITSEEEKALFDSVAKTYVEKVAQMYSQLPEENASLAGINPDGEMFASLSLGEVLNKAMESLRHPEVQEEALSIDAQIGAAQPEMIGDVSATKATAQMRPALKPGEKLIPLSEAAETANSYFMTYTGAIVQGDAEYALRQEGAIVRNAEGVECFIAGDILRIGRKKSSWVDREKESQKLQGQMDALVQDATKAKDVLSLYVGNKDDPTSLKQAEFFCNQIKSKYKITDPSIKGSGLDASNPYDVRRAEANAEFQMRAHGDAPIQDVLAAYIARQDEEVKILNEEYMRVFAELETHTEKQKDKILEQHDAINKAARLYKDAQKDVRLLIGENDELFESLDDALNALAAERADHRRFRRKVYWGIGTGVAAAGFAAVLLIAPKVEKYFNMKRVKAEAHQRQMKRLDDMNSRFSASLERSFERIRSIPKPMDYSRIGPDFKQSPEKTRAKQLNK